MHILIPFELLAEINKSPEVFIAAGNLVVTVEVGEVFELCSLWIDFWNGE